MEKAEPEGPTRRVETASSHMQLTPDLVLCESLNSPFVWEQLAPNTQRSAAQDMPAAWLASYSLPSSLLITYLSVKPLVLDLAVVEPPAEAGAEEQEDGEADLETKKASAQTTRAPPRAGCRPPPWPWIGLGGPGTS